WEEVRINLEMRLGLVELAEKHAIERLERSATGYHGPMFAALFPELGAPAETVWRLLRKKYPNEHESEILKRLRLIEHRQIAPNDLRDRLLFAVPDNSWLPQAWVTSRFEPLASVVHRAEHAELAAAMLKEPGWDKAPPGALVLLADTLAEAKQWPAA